jgi:alcohol dehydrogenase class IV
VIFGAGSLAQVPEELVRMGSQRALIIASGSQRQRAEQLAQLLGSACAGIYDRVTQHVPIEDAYAARQVATDLGVDVCVALGGGSPIGLAKAVALSSSLPILAIPTTYAGSEMTTIWGMTEGGVKRTGRDIRVLPAVVVYDPELTLDLPVAIAGPSGINALAHCVEALYAHDANPITSLMAEEGICALAASLPQITRSPADPNPRSLALYGAWLAGSALGMVAMGLHHKLCHTLGGRYKLPHAELHTVLLPYTAAYNQNAAATAMLRIARALGATNAPAGLHELNRSIGAPASLREIGMPAEALDEAAALASSAAYPNPAPLTQTGIRQLLEDAFWGKW